ncbi:MAG: hypothetical protein U0350_44985 [Caldilineaceae bacterium]
MVHSPHDKLAFCGYHSIGTKGATGASLQPVAADIALSGADCIWHACLCAVGRLDILRRALRHHHHHDHHRGRTFAIFFTLFAIGLAGYALSTAAAIIFEGHQAKMAFKRLETRMKKIAALSNHIIVCGGILANRAASEFGRRNVPFVLSEADEAKLKQTLLWLHAAYVERRQRHYGLGTPIRSGKDTPTATNWSRGRLHRTAVLRQRCGATFCTPHSTFRTL